MEYGGWSGDCQDFWGHAGPLGVAELEVGNLPESRRFTAVVETAFVINISPPVCVWFSRTGRRRSGKNSNEAWAVFCNIAGLTIGVPGAGRSAWLVRICTRCYARGFVLKVFFQRSVGVFKCFLALLALFHRLPQSGNIL